jgi:hypothetical protein
MARVKLTAKSAAKKSATKTKLKLKSGGKAAPRAAAKSGLRLAKSAATTRSRRGRKGEVAVATSAPGPVPAGRPGIRDKVLGALTWNDELKSYHGKVEFRGRPIDVTVVLADFPELLQNALNRARDVVAKLDAYADKAESFAAELHEMESGPETAEQVPQQPAVIAKFRRAMRLKSVEFHATGSVTFLHDDGNSFWGHLIEVTMTAEDQLTGARQAA